MNTRSWVWVAFVVLWAGCASPARTPADAGMPQDAEVKPGMSRRAMRLWLRADQGVVASDGKVSRWKDQSGGGRDAIMSSVPRQPSLRRGALNDNPVVHFDGAQSLYLEALVEPTVFTVFVVGKNNETEEHAFSMILGPGGNEANNQLRWQNGTEVLAVGTGNNMPVVRTSIGDTRTWHLLTLHYDGSTLRLYRNGKPVGNHDFSTQGPWTFAQVGGYYSEHFAKADLAEVLVYDDALLGGEREAVEHYLKSKYRLD
ncbi:LamG domain-containing protein [Pyxidicoccus trucidator]|uniref:LamG domain-containing protein n=1 Tax=Pyxidicoccus trucidator TaxID=2709662 RepID=UPI001F07D4AA|nr:LamG domain-containing protein [Pyxidicoccus trucidator]